MFGFGGRSKFFLFLFLEADLNFHKGFESGPKSSRAIGLKEYTWVRPCVEFGKLRVSMGFKILIQVEVGMGSGSDFHLTHTVPFFFDLYKT